MSPKIALAILFAASASVGKGQNNATDSIHDSYHLFFPAVGKDILAAHIGAHSYKIVNICDRPSEVFVDDRKLTGDELSKYADIIQRIKASVKDEEEDREMRQMERDRRQEQRDQRQAERDREQAQKDREQQQRDRAQQTIDRETSRRDQEQAQREREQTQREREQTQREREQRQRERQHDQYIEQAVSVSNKGDDDMDQAVSEQREQFAEDRAMLKKGIQILLDEHVINDSQTLKTLVLTDTDVSVNGVKQSPNLYQQIRTKLGEWARNGFSYGATGPTDNYSLSIND
jgi:hypothetical protein